MDAIFSLPYSEYEVINQLQKVFKKGDDFSFCIPTSRQEKGIDFIIYNKDTKISKTIQVKSSRSYEKTADKKEKFQHNFWFSNFIDKYKVGTADYYMFFCLYPAYTTNTKVESWKNIIICIPDTDMGNFLKEVKTKKKQKKDSHFGISFNTPDVIYGNRGFENNPDLSKYLIKNQIELLKKSFK